MYAFAADPALPKPELYRELLAAADALTADEPDPVANMANLAALIAQLVPELNWAGFYRLIEGELVLGPFSGKPACIRIPLGQGVCAAIGGAIGSESDRDRLDECEAYLLRHEQGYRGPVYAQAHGYPQGHAQGAYGYHYPYPYPVMWVKVPIVTERRGCGCETVVEEWVEEEETTPPPARRAKIRRVAPEPAPAPAPAPGKRLRASK